MTIPLPEYTAPYKPVPQVTPFTYRDGVTMLKKLELLQRYINRNLVPFVNDNMEELGDAFETQANALIEAVNAAIALVLEGSVEANDPIIAGLIADTESLTYEALVAWGNARHPVYRKWNGSAYPARIAGASNLFIGPDDPGVAMDNANDFWLNPNFTTIAAVTTMGDGRWPVYRVWNGSAYPTRIAGAVNIFFGPNDPGLAMGAGDYWANPAVTTLAAVNAALLDTSSQTFINMFTATDSGYIDLPVMPRSPDASIYKAVDGTYTDLYGWEMSASLIVGLACNVKIPYGWNTARVRIFYYVPTGATGDMRVTRAGATYGTASAAPTVVAEVSNTVVAPAAGQSGSVLITGDIDLVGKSELSIVVKRAGNNAADTLSTVSFFTGVRLERTS